MKMPLSVGVLVALTFGSGGVWAGRPKRPLLRGDAKGVEVERRGRRGHGRGRWRRSRHSRGRRPVLQLAGSYSGVRPGTKVEPPGPKPPTGTCWLTWPGFSLTPRGSRVFLEFNERVEPQLVNKGRTIRVLFPGCRVRLRNNGRRLVTRYFPTPVLWVRARNRGRNLEITIRTRRPVQPRVSWQRADGFFFYYLDFPR